MKFSRKNRDLMPANDYLIPRNALHKNTEDHT